jgi:hypothetical protein
LINIGGAWWARFALPTLQRSSKRRKIPLRQRTNFASQFNVIWVVQIARQK